MMWLSMLVLLLPSTAVVCLEDKTKSTVVDDIWNAFRAVTNDSALLDHIIPEMYAASMQKTNPSFVFKMPTSERDGYQMLTMQRSDFSTPIFPNISSQSNIVGDDAVQPTLDGNSHLKSSPAVEWQQLGLQGWVGELKPPLPWQEQSHKDVHPQPPALPLAEYPRAEIIHDLKNQHFNGRVTDIRVIATNQHSAPVDDLMNGENVYIARANDPFGYSMRWALNNDTTVHDQASNERGKRDVAKLYSMIKCSTSCDPLIYKGYGCYCGFGGHGVPTDGIDRCCRLHDKCYGQSNCISYLEYFVPYVWKCYRGKPLCAIDHGEWGGPDSCAARLCQCDLRLSRCLRKFYCPNGRAVCRSSRSRRLQNLIFFD
ncbi:uncharacterized protein LOC117576125 [Drosophila albomicans]|uniref:Phospholipase A2 n=1 Tax=Drosophila albomicans TaxID=7291 RepID=A0A6P8XTQ3_DROAB|nr:uncharacterized protein LOC117576125 [Drosophila albomicans]